MGKFVDLTGQKFGRLTVIERAGRDKNRNTLWLCKCDCGGETITRGDALKNGKTKSCGCLFIEARKARAEDLTGQRFGRLIALHRDESKHRTAWLCKCDCGNEVIVTSLNLKNGSSNSCGCYQRDRAAESQTKHGLCNTRRYCIWSAMIKRCENINDHGYHNYGGRGITICKEWREDFMSFYTWAGSNGYSSNLTIDRIDNNGNYEPANCRWVTVKENNRNTRSCVYIEIDGSIKTLSGWSEFSGVDPCVIHNRFKSGKKGSDLLTPVKKSNKEKTDRERLYITFNSIKARCYKSTNKSYKNYGGRGIFMCDAWLKDFNIFYNWSLASGYNPDLTLDRIDNDGPYSPENCRWVNMKMQSSNKRNNVYLTYKGESKTVTELAKYLGLSRETLAGRAKAGMPDEKLFYKGKLSKLKKNTPIIACST
jgi:hypothetical protein